MASNPFYSEILYNPYNLSNLFQINDQTVRKVIKVSYHIC